MKNTSINVALLLPLLVVALLMGTKLAQAALTINPEGSWKVVGTTASGAVGDVVTIELGITFVTDSYADTDFYIKTEGEARQKLSFVGVTPPAGNPSVSAEQIDWPKTEFEAGATKKYNLQVRINNGAVGDEIKGFYISTYTGKSIMYGVADDMKIKVIAKSSTKPTSTTTPAPTKTNPKPTTPSPVVISSPEPTAIPAPVAITLITPTSAPINPIDPDGDGLPNDQEVIWGSNPNIFDTDKDGMPDGDEIRNGTNPAGDFSNVSTPSPLATTIQPQPSPVPPKQPFFSRIISNIQERFRTIGNWLTELF